MVFDDDGLHGHVARGAQVQGAAEHLLAVRQQLEARQVLDGRELAVLGVLLAPLGAGRALVLLPLLIATESVCLP